MIPERRQFLQTLLLGTMATGAVVVGLLPANLLANPLQRPKALFEITDLSKALKAFTQVAVTEPSDQIQIEAPEIAGSGSSVRVSVDVALPKVESIALFVEKNPSPFNCSYVLHPDLEPYIATSIKMNESSDIIAVVKSDGKYYSARKTVKITMGGCGG